MSLRQQGDDWRGFQFPSFPAKPSPSGLASCFLSCNSLARVQARFMAAAVKLERTALTRQTTFWRDRLIELSSLQALLREERPLPKEFTTLMRCRTEENVHAMVCENCGEPHHFDYHCNKRFCPCCAWQLSCERRKILEGCAHLLRQPKHVVLTARNQSQLKAMFRVVLNGVRKLRRREIFSSVKGGWCSFEVTNEGRGWHVHAHLLVDVRWMPASDLAREWAACVGQDFAIVKVKDAREQKYLAEVTKYTVKPSVFIGWPQEQRVEFVKSIRGRRMFFAFGHVAKESAKFRVLAKELRGIARTKCCTSETLTSVSVLARHKSLRSVSRFAPSTRRTAARE